MSDQFSKSALPFWGAFRTKESQLDKKSGVFIRATLCLLLNSHKVNIGLNG